jgi:thymidine phosphorylase
MILVTCDCLPECAQVATNREQKVPLHAQLGQKVEAGAPLMTLHTDEPARFERALEALDGAFKIESSAPERKIVLERIN